MVHWSTLALSSGLLHGAAHALPQGSVSSATAPSVTVSTAVASPSVPLSSALPSQVPLPPKQAWCPSEIFCAGELLQTVNLAAAYGDPKTFVDKPTSKSSQQVLSAFNAISNSTGTEGDIVNFLDNNFRGEGLELEAATLANFNDNPASLNNISDPLIKAFSQTVHGYWAQLTRTTNQSALCPEGSESGSCESTLIPLNHTFVVPGGRFREQYYWDSYWIVQGLIKSELYDVVKETLENFMDELQNFGFIPNGGRIYYLNRSQPPLFIHMLSDYVAASNDTSVLERGLPLAEKELAWWATHRTVNVTSPSTNTTYAMARYAVNNTAPRPESYLTDYLTANDPTLPSLDEDQRSNLYAELASGAESGWDYSSRWAKEPFAATATSQNPILRSLNIRSIIPVCLNSILYKAHGLLGDLYSSQNNATAAKTHQDAAANIRAGILDLLWDGQKLAFYDFNLTANARSTIFSAATFYPLWNGIIPDEVAASSQNAFGFFASLNLVLNRYNGTFPVTFLETGLQWDAPNAWPPHQYIALEALRALPANVSGGSLPTPSSGQSTYSLIPANQIGIAEGSLPVQAVAGGKNASQTGSAADINKLDGTVFNGGNKTDGEGWAATLQRELANRYIASALCSWHATGGQIQGLLPRLSDQELNVTQSVNNTGNMFEKFSISDIDSAGRGGEYTVQAGFGWTNGAALWVASTYGDKLVTPQCPDLLASAAATTGGGKNAAASHAQHPLDPLFLQHDPHDPQPPEQQVLQRLQRLVQPLQQSPHVPQQSLHEPHVHGQDPHSVEQPLQQSVHEVQLGHDLQHDPHAPRQPSQHDPHEGQEPQLGQDLQQEVHEVQLGQDWQQEPQEPRQSLQQVPHEGQDPQLGQEGHDPQLGQEGHDPQLGQEGHDPQLGQDSQQEPHEPRQSLQQSPQEGQEGQLGQLGQDLQQEPQELRQPLQQSLHDGQDPQLGQDLQQSLQDGQDPQLGHDLQQSLHDGQDPQLGQDPQPEQLGQDPQLGHDPQEQEGQDPHDPQGLHAPHGPHGSEQHSQHRTEMRDARKESREPTPCNR